MLVIDIRSKKIIRFGIENIEWISVDKLFYQISSQDHTL